MTFLSRIVTVYIDTLSRIVATHIDTLEDTVNSLLFWGVGGVFLSLLDIDVYSRESNHSALIFNFSTNSLDFGRW